MTHDSGDAAADIIERGKELRRLWDNLKKADDEFLNFAISILKEDDRSTADCISGGAGWCLNEAERLLCWRLYRKELSRPEPGASGGKGG